MPTDPVVIVSAARTPMGGFQGELKGFSAPELGAASIRAAVERAKLKAEEKKPPKKSHANTRMHNPSSNLLPTAT